MPGPGDLDPGTQRNARRGALTAPGWRTPGEGARGRGKTRSEPAAVQRDADRLRAIAGGGLLDRGGQVVADRALGEVEAAGDLGVEGAVGRGAQDVPLAGGEGVGALAEGGRGEGGVDDLLAAQDGAHGVREPRGGGVL